MLQKQRSPSHGAVKPLSSCPLAKGVWWLFACVLSPWIMSSKGKVPTLLPARSFWPWGLVQLLCP